MPTGSETAHISHRCISSRSECCGGTSAPPFGSLSHPVIALKYRSNGCHRCLRCCGRRASYPQPPWQRGAAARQLAAGKAARRPTCRRSSCCGRCWLRWPRILVGRQSQSPCVCLTVCSGRPARIRQGCAEQALCHMPYFLNRGGIRACAGASSVHQIAV